MSLKHPLSQSEELLGYVLGRLQFANTTSDLFRTDFEQFAAVVKRALKLHEWTKPRYRKRLSALAEQLHRALN